MRKKKFIPMDIEDLSYEEEYEEAGFGDIPSGTVVAQFSFGDDPVPLKQPSKTNEPEGSKKPVQAQKFTTAIEPQKT